MSLLSRVLSALLPALALASLALVAPAAHAQANVTFSGGSGSLLSITLNAPVTYTITTARASTLLVFVFNAAGNPFTENSRRGTGTLTFSVNGGVSQTVDIANSGSGVQPDGVVADSIYIGNDDFYSPFAVNDQIVLTAGTLPRQIVSRVPHR